MKARHLPARPDRRNAAFSLIEIALALGIVGFALVGIVGALPIAMNNGRLSIVQSRAASLANTVFASFRAQSFSSVQYVDLPIGAPTPAPGGTGTINLNTKTSSSRDSVTFYAAFDEVVPPLPSADARRLHFSDTIPPTTPYFVIVLRFDNNPTRPTSSTDPTPVPLFLAPYNAASGSLHAQANAIEASIYEVDRPKDVFHFSSLIANRLD